jgi:energy-coupling factor transporter transmembrane protein EcfT
MIRSVRLTGVRSQKQTRSEIGTLGYLALFLTSLGLVMLAPPARIVPAALGCLALNGLLYPRAVRNSLSVRWLVLMVLLALPPVFFLEQADRNLWGLPYSSAGLQAGIQIALRMLVVLVAVQGFTASVDISTLAGLFERLGLHGLGFSLGVALNLLPVLQDSAAHTWHSLWMRGGLRRQRWRGLQLLLVTVMTNALRRAEEIALAAECRAFSPQRAQAFPLQAGRFDRAILLAGLLVVLAVRFLQL